jgi:hypothetical protein
MPGMRDVPVACTLSSAEPDSRPGTLLTGLSLRRIRLIRPIVNPQFAICNLQSAI